MKCSGESCQRAVSCGCPLASDCSLRVLWQIMHQALQRAIRQDAHLVICICFVYWKGNSLQKLSLHNHILSLVTCKGIPIIIILPFYNRGLQLSENQTTFLLLDCAGHQACLFLTGIFNWSTHFLPYPLFLEKEASSLYYGEIPSFFLLCNPCRFISYLINSLASDKGNIGKSRNFFRNFTEVIVLEILHVFLFII